MKLIKTASGKTIIKMSKCEWEKIGRTAGWFATLCAACKKLLYPPKHIPNTPDSQVDKSHGFCPKCYKDLYEKDLMKAGYTKEQFIKEIIEQEHRILNAWKNVSEKPSADLFIHNYPELV